TTLFRSGGCGGGATSAGLAMKRGINPTTELVRSGLPPPQPSPASGGGSRSTRLVCPPPQAGGEREQIDASGVALATGGMRASRSTRRCCPRRTRRERGQVDASGVVLLRRRRAKGPQ